MTSPHPTYGAPLGGAPRTWAGVVFRPYRISIMRSAWISDDFRIEIKNRGDDLSTFTASLDGTYIVGADGARARRFRSDRNAAEAAVKALRAKRQQAAEDDAATRPKDPRHL